MIMAALDPFFSQIVSNIWVRLEQDSLALNHQISKERPCRYRSHREICKWLTSASITSAAPRAPKRDLSYLLVHLRSFKNVLCNIFNSQNSKQPCSRYQVNAISTFSFGHVVHSTSSRPRSPRASSGLCLTAIFTLSKTRSRDRCNLEAVRHQLRESTWRQPQSELLFSSFLPDCLFMILHMSAF
jgi:hypothetical protein